MLIQRRQQAAPSPSPLTRNQSQCKNQGITSEAWRVDSAKTTNSTITITAYKKSITRSKELPLHHPGADSAKTTNIAITITITVYKKHNKHPGITKMSTISLYFVRHDEYLLLCKPYSAANISAVLPSYSKPSPGPVSGVPQCMNGTSNRTLPSPI